MKHSFLLIMLLTATITVLADQSDQALTEKLVGKWEFMIGNGDISIKAQEEYKSDGTVQTHGQVFKNGSLIEEYNIKSLWKIANSYIYVEIIESTSSVLKAGLRTTDKIISIDDHEFTFESEDGVQTTMKRIK